jgi:hypothetical protein
MRLRVLSRAVCCAQKNDQDEIDSSIHKKNGMGQRSQVTGIRLRMHGSPARCAHRGRIEQG